MGKRTRVVGATVFMLVGALAVITSYAGGTDLQAGGIEQLGFDVAKYLIWGGAGALLISALLFISASAE